MTPIFLEKAFFGFVALAVALVAAIYQMFNKTINQEIKISKNEVKNEIKETFSITFEKDIGEIKKSLDSVIKDFDFLTKEVESLKRHETNNAKFQQEMFRDIKRDDDEKIKYLKEIMEKIKK